MTRRIVAVPPPTEKRVSEWVLCPSCSLLVEVAGGIFKRHYGYDAVCNQSGKYPPTYK